MSTECRKQLRRRQKIIAHDYKADFGLVKACKAAIKEFRCKKNAEKDLERIGEIGPTELQTTRLSSILLCLEGKKIVLIINYFVYILPLNLFSFFENLLIGIIFRCCTREGRRTSSQMYCRNGGT